MKKKVLSLTLALLMCLSLITVTASAITPGVTQESAVELKVGESGTFQGLSGIMDDWDAHFWYKFQLSTASKVVITLNVPAAPIDHTNGAYVFVTASDTVNEMNRYVDGVGDVNGLTLEQSFEAGNLGEEEGQVISRTGTYYLGEGLYYLCIGCDLDKGIIGSVKIDSIEPISNTGGMTMESARTVDPAKEVIKQTRFDEEEVEGKYYYKFTLLEPAEVSIKKSVKLVPSVDDRGNFGSSLFLSGPDTDMLGTVDGEVDVSPLYIGETDRSLTKTITYSLPAGTYYVYLNCSWSSPGTEYTLSFSINGGGIPNLDSASGWAHENLNEAYELGLIPAELQSVYKQTTTRAEFCALAVALYERVTGKEITERESFTDTSDPNVEKMAGLKVVDGKGSGLFDPDGQLTREQAATLVSRLADALGKPLPKQAASFADVGTISGYALDAVGQVQAAGIMTGKDNNMFAPKDPYPREQSIITMLRLYNIVK